MSRNIWSRIKNARWTPAVEAVITLAIGIAGMAYALGAA